MPTPCSMAALGECILSRCPTMLIWPSSGRYSPARMLISVVLPAPFSPSRACTSPHRAAKSMPVLAATPGKALSMRRISTAKALLTFVRPAGLALRNVADDVAERPVHLIGLDIGVVRRLPRLRRRAFIGVTQRLALRRLHVAMVIYQRPLPDVEGASLDLSRDVHRHRRHVLRNEARGRSRLNQPILHVVVELNRFPRTGHDRFHAVDVVRPPDEAI